MPVDDRSSRSVAGLTDWVSDRRTFILLWCLPAAAMAGATYLEPLRRAVIWTAMLLVMGGACLANARRCKRTHCRFTGPFFVLMAGVTLALAVGVFDPGPHGWSILSGFIVVGGIGLWWGSERLWVTYSD